MNSTENKSTENESKKSEHKSDGKENWTVRLGELVSVCQDEIKRTTEIGKRMLTASKTNTDLHESYEALGRHICDQIRKEKLTLDDSEVSRLIEKIGDCEKILEGLEKEVSEIKEDSN